jgi:predicted porin
MQKKVLALAVAGLLSGAAFAQTAVIFGGSIATDITSSTSHQYNGLADGTYKSKFSVDDSNWQASRLWWKAQEDLGNGLGVEAYQEMRMRTDNRANPVNRRSYLQLSSKTMGTIKGVGGFGNVLDDALGLSEAKSADWGKGVVNPLIAGNAATNDTTYNTAQYITPDFSGFKLKLSASGNDAINATDELDGNGKVNVRALGLNGTYLNGPIKVAVAHLRKTKDGNSLKDTIVSGMYDFGKFQLGAAYAYAKNDKLAGFAWNLYNNAGGTIAGLSTTDWKRNGYRLNLGVDITPMDHVGLSYSYAKVKFASGGDSANVKGLGLSYTHMLSKRTTFLAEFAGLSMDENRAPVSGQYERIVRVGMRHDF